MDGTVEVGDLPVCSAWGSIPGTIVSAEAVSADLRRRLAPAATRGIALHGLR